ncbi:hypothetical protein YC2023_046168 [Brassica napus]
MKGVLEMMIRVLTITIRTLTMMIRTQVMTIQNPTMTIQVPIVYGCDDEIFMNKLKVETLNERSTKMSNLSEIVSETTTYG